MWQFEDKPNLPPLVTNKITRISYARNDTQQCTTTYILQHIPEDYHTFSNTDTFRYGQTLAMISATLGFIPPEDWEHSPSMRDNNKRTVAMHLASLGIIPPPIWQHETDLRDMTGFTVALYLASLGIYVPSQWEHISHLQTKMGKTVAMLYVENDLMVPMQWHHNTDIKEHVNGCTVAMMYAGNIFHPCIPPKEWEHTSTIADKHGNTVAIILAINGILPSRVWEHKASICNFQSNNVPMLLASRGVIPPTQWRIYPGTRYSNGVTVAMILAFHGIIPPQWWEHESNLFDNLGRCVGGLLHSKNIVVPPQWYLSFVCDVLEEQCTCMVCLDDKVDVVVKAKCGHKLCVKCSCQWWSPECPYCKCGDFRTLVK